MEWSTSFLEIWARIEKRGKRKKQNGGTKTDNDYILTNRPDIVTVTDVTVINQFNIGSDHRLVMSNTKLDVEVEWKNYDQEATESRCHTNRIKEDQIPTVTEKHIRDTTRTRRHRHHERNHPRQNPTKHITSS